MKRMNSPKIGETASLRPNSARLAAKDQAFLGLVSDPAELSPGANDRSRDTRAERTSGATLPPASDECVVYDRNNIEDLDRSTIKNLTSAQLQYLCSMIKNGVAWHIENVPDDVDYQLIVHQGCALPFTVSTQQQTVFPVSPKTCWFDYAELLYKKSFGRRPAPVSRFLLSTIGRLVRFERLVVLNNWWLTNNPTPAVSDDDIRAFVAFLTSAYPDHMLLIKSIPEPDPTNVIRPLRRNGFDLIKFRDMHFWSKPAPGESRGTKNFRRDRNLLKETLLRKYKAKVLSPSKAVQCERLYQSLYIEKHTSMNTQLTRRWLALACNSGFVDFYVLEDKSGIRGFIICYDDPLGINVGTCGNDPETQQQEGIYRMLIAWILKNAGRDGKTANLSTSVARFKELLGCRRVTEFEGVYTKHLRLRTRILMKAFIWCYNNALSKMRCA